MNYGLTLLLIQAEELWRRRRSFERSSKYKQILINSWVIYQIPVFQFGCLNILYYLKKIALSYCTCACSELVPFIGKYMFCLHDFAHINYTTFGIEC